jgi:Ca2+-binding RTX toxin-like protein
VPAYAFDSITASQAGSFVAGVDTLSFSAGTTPISVLVADRPPVGPTVQGPALTVGNRTVGFGTGFPGTTIIFPDASKLFVGGTANESVTGTTGGDHLVGRDGADTLSGLDGSDVLEGGAGDDSLNGGAGDDTLAGGAGVDTLDGGSGADLLSFNPSTTGVRASLSGGGDGVGQIFNFEGLEGSAFADTLAGDSLGNVLRGGRGDDNLAGNLGDDTLEGGFGDDVIDGGLGTDTLVYTNATSGVFVNLETNNTISFDTTLGQDTLNGVENVIAGGFNDVLTGDFADNRLVGLAGGDTLTGGRGADTLDGGEGIDSLGGGDGDDWLIGGGGADSMDAGAGLDVIELRAGDSPMDGAVTLMDRIKGFGDDLLLFRGGVTPTAANFIEEDLGAAGARPRALELYAQGYEYIAIQVGAQVQVFAPRIGVSVLLDNYSTSFLSLINIRNEPPVRAPSGPATMGDDLLTGAGNDTLDGLTGADTIVEASGTNYLRGGEGNDSIVGGSGFDDINGNMGNDTCASGGGDDWVVGGKDNDSLVGSAGANLVYGNLGADTCDGGAGNDVVRGGQDADVLNGGEGDDYVSGDRGDDTVTGGAGADIFHSFGEAGVDLITDFNLAQGDRVQLDPGTQYNVFQVGADTVISMSGGGQVILVGVQMSTLTGSWIFGA